MRSIKTEFAAAGRLRLNFGEEVAGVQNAVRAACVNLLSVSGADPVFEERGTGLGWRNFASNILTETRGGSLAKFAALDTVFFARGNHDDDFADMPDEIILDPVVTSPDTLVMNLTFKTTDGRVVSYPDPNET